MQHAPYPPLRSTQDDYTWLMICMASGAMPLEFREELETPKTDTTDATNATATTHTPDERPWGPMLWGVGLWLVGLVAVLSVVDRTTPALTVQAEGNAPVPSVQLGPSSVPQR